MARHMRESSVRQNLSYVLFISCLEVTILTPSQNERNSAHIQPTTDNSPLSRQLLLNSDSRGATMISSGRLSLIVMHRMSQLILTPLSPPQIPRSVLATIFYCLLTLFRHKA